MNESKELTIKVKSFVRYTGVFPKRIKEHTRKIRGTIGRNSRYSKRGGVALDENHI